MRSGAAIARTKIVAWAKATDSPALCIRREPLFDQLADRCHERRMRTRGSGAHQPEAEFPGTFLSFDVEIEQHFHVIRDESNRRHDQLIHTGLR